MTLLVIMHIIAPMNLWIYESTLPKYSLHQEIGNYYPDPDPGLKVTS